MLYVVITVSLVFLSVIILLPKFNNFNERYSLSINYVLTLVATLIGVLLAIAISNHEADKKENEDVIKLLGSSMSSVETCHDYTEKLIEYYDSLPKDDESKKDFFSKNQPPYPDYLDIFLMQNVVSKNLTSDTLSDLNEQVINLKRSHGSDAFVYLVFLEQTLAILSLELSFQKGEISTEQLNAKLDALEEF